MAGDRHTTLHAGYSRYFSPPPFENIATESTSRSSSAPRRRQTHASNDTPKAERANYFDAGVSQKILATGFTLGIDSYYKRSSDLIDEGQFGAPIILTPFNYQHGKQYGVEFTVDYTSDAVCRPTAISRWSMPRARTSSPASSTSIPAISPTSPNHYIHLDHEQDLTASAGASYRLGWTRCSAPTCSTARACGSDGADAERRRMFRLRAGQFRRQPRLRCRRHVAGFTARFDVINLFDEKYEIRDGTGVGVGAPQFGARRGFFVGLSKAI